MRRKEGGEVLRNEKEKVQADVVRREMVGGVLRSAEVPELQGGAVRRRGGAMERSSALWKRQGRGVGGRRKGKTQP